MTTHERINLQIALLETINTLAEEDMLAGNSVTGAHHRAIEKVLKELRQAKEASRER